MISLSSSRPQQGRLFIFITLLVALVIDVVPLPLWAEPFRPQWVTMVLIYWCMATPETVGVAVAALVGLVLDLMFGSLLGQNALALSLVAFLCIAFHLRVRMFPLWQQALFVLVLVTVDIAVNVWVRGIIGEYQGSWAHWTPALSSALLWPWLFVILRDIRRYAGRK